MKGKRIIIAVAALMFAFNTMSISAYAQGNSKITPKQGNAQIQQNKKETKKHKQNKKGDRGGRNKKATSL